MIGKCQLCLDESCDLKKSHIISEFNYAACYDGAHRFYRLSTVGPKHKKFEQKGYREHLLCQRCETKLSKWELYAKEILVDGGFESATRYKWGYSFDGVDYTRFKLYLLSLLWRMGISSLDMFGCVNLGPHEERLRLALFNEDPLGSHQYPVLLVGVTLAGRFIEDFIVPPSLAKVESHHCYRCVINGILYTFVVGSHRLDPFMEERAFGEDGVIDLPMMEVRDIPFLHDQFCRMHEALKKPGSP